MKETNYVNYAQKMKDEFHFQTERHKYIKPYYLTHISKYKFNKLMNTKKEENYKT